MRSAISTAGRLLGATTVLLLCAATVFAAEPNLDKLWVYVGTYTGKGSKGIYRFELDLASGKAGAATLAAEAANPSFVAIHPNRRYLYAAGEIDNFGGTKTGAVSAFAIDSKTGDLTLLNQQPSGGAGPCH